MGKGWVMEKVKEEVMKKGGEKGNGTEVMKGKSWEGGEKDNKR